MKFLLAIVVLLSFSFLDALGDYPQLYSNQGTPLYKSAKSVENFSDFSSLKLEVTKYIKEIEKTKKAGFKADSSSAKEEKIVYLKSLRSLQSTHDKILQHSIKILNGYIKENDYKSFLKMVNIGMPYYQKKSILNEKILAYYKKNRDRKKSRLLDDIIKKNSALTVSYFSSQKPSFKKVSTVEKRKLNEKKIILLSRPGCGFCVKAKRFLDSSGKSYEEYNIQNSKGRKLFRKHNGNGVPLVIIGDKVIRGFNVSAMKKALN